MAINLNHNEMITMEILLNHPKIGFYSVSRFAEKQGYSLPIDEIHKTLKTLQKKGLIYLSDTENNKLTGEEIKRYSASCSGEEYLNLVIEWYREGLLKRVLAKLVGRLKELWILQAILERLNRRAPKK